MSLANRSTRLLIVLAVLTLVCCQTNSPPTTTAAKPKDYSTEPHRALTSADGLSCSFTQDISANVGSGLNGTMSGVANHFKCSDKTKQEVELELVSTALVKAR